MRKLIRSDRRRNKLVGAKQIRIFLKQQTYLLNKDRPNHPFLLPVELYQCYFYAVLLITRTSFTPTVIVKPINFHYDGR